VSSSRYSVRQSNLTTDRRPDAYHSCYTLAGLSSVQHIHYYNDVSHAGEAYPLDSAPRWVSGEQVAQDVQTEREEVYDPEDKLMPMHPIYVIPWAAVERTHARFAAKIGF